MSFKLKTFSLIILSFMLVLSSLFADSSYVRHDLDNNPLTLNELLKLEDNSTYKDYNKDNYFVVPVAHSFLHEEVLYTYYDFVYYIFDSSPSKVQIFDVDQGKRIIFNDECYVMYCSYYPVTKDSRVNVYPTKKQVGDSFFLERTTTTEHFGEVFTKPCYALFFGNFRDIKFDEGIRQGHPNPPENSPQGAGEGLTKYLPIILEFLVWFLSSLLGLHLSLKLLRKFTNISR